MKNCNFFSLLSLTWFSTYTTVMSIDLEPSRHYNDNIITHNNQTISRDFDSNSNLKLIMTKVEMIDTRINEIKSEYNKIDKMMTSAKKTSRIWAFNYINSIKDLELYKKQIDYQTPNEQIEKKIKEIYLKYHPRHNK